jgi:hypothetical protein
MHTAIHIPEPCAESWDAMTPTATGRHCAACQKTVIDFTLKTDTEILELLAQARGTSTCVRFRAEQLDRPLQPLVVTVRNRWRTWLVAAAAVWALRGAASPDANAQTPATHSVHPRKKKPGQPARSCSALRISGFVRDADTEEGLAGIAVFLKGENRSTRTDATGRFSLVLPAGSRDPARHTLVLHMAGYYSQTVLVPSSSKAAANLDIALVADATAEGVVVNGVLIESRQRYVSGSMGTPVQIVNAYTPTDKERLRNRFSLFQWLSRPFRR